MTTIKFTILC